MIEEQLGTRSSIARGKIRMMLGNFGSPGGMEFVQSMIWILLFDQDRILGMIIYIWMMGRKF